MRISYFGSVLGVAIWLVACASSPTAPPESTSPPVPAKQPVPVEPRHVPVEPEVVEEVDEEVSLATQQQAQKDAQKQYQAGLSAYHKGKYAQAKALFAKSASQPLLGSRTRASALKFLAFMSCSENQLVACKQYFRRALAISPKFKLLSSEASHPVWGAAFEEVRRGRK
jgi:hypothetical protein